MNAAILVDLVGNIGNTLELGRSLFTCNERAFASDTNQKSFVREFAQRPVGGHAADTEHVHQFILRWYTLADRPFARFDAAANVVLEFDVKRRGNCRFILPIFDLFLYRVHGFQVAWSSQPEISASDIGKCMYAGMGVPYPQMMVSSTCGP